MDTSDPAANTPDPREQRALRRLESLQRLTEISLSVAHDVSMMMTMELARRQDEAGLETPPNRVGVLDEMNRAHDHIARSVRLTVTLEARLDAEPGARVRPIPRGLPELPALVQPPPVPVQPEPSVRRPALQKGFVSEALSLAIETEAPETERENLWGALHERLQEAEDEDLFDQMPTEHLIRVVARDLGLTDEDDAAFLKAWGQPLGSTEPPAGATGRLVYGRAVIKRAIDSLGKIKAEARQALAAQRLARERSG